MAKSGLESKLRRKEADIHNNSWLQEQRTNTLVFKFNPSNFIQGKFFIRQIKLLKSYLSHFIFSAKVILMWNYNFVLKKNSYYNVLSFLQVDGNVILVDWDKGSTYNYLTCLSNIRIVASEIARWQISRVQLCDSL